MTVINAVGNALTGSTGTGNFVGATGPTISAPLINQINGANGKIVQFNSAAMSSSYVTIGSAASGNDVPIGADGTDTDISLSYVPKGAGAHVFLTTSNTPLYIQSGTGYQRLSRFIFGNTSATYDYTYPSASGTMLITGTAISTVPSIAFSSTSGVIGTTTNDSAAAGSVGEVISSTVLFASAVSLTTGVGANLTSISLTAGDWDVWGSASFSTVGVFDYVVAGVSVDSAVTPDASMCGQLNFNGATVVGVACPMQVYKLNSTTTVYLAVGASFTVNGDVCGTLFARRRR